jgi:hypothetical protein
MTEALAAFRQKPKMLKAQLATAPAEPLRAVAGAKAPAMPAFTRMPLAMAAEKPTRSRGRGKSA